MKRLSLLTIFLAGSAVFVAAQDSTITAGMATKDSTIQLIKKNPRAGFKNLFEVAVLAPGITAAHLNPQAFYFVQDYLQHYGSHLTKMKSWGKPYFDMMDGVLTRYGLPSELKYLAVIESSLKSYAVSWVGAVGPWQFMPATARNLGLRVNKKVDERTDFFKSTDAAARYLTDLYAIYGDWLLVVAAYNGGIGNVNAAIRKSKSHNFWELQYYLPNESRKHVKKFIATHYIMEGQGSVATVGKSEQNDLLLLPKPDNRTDSTLASVPINGGSKYNSIVIANYVKMEIAEFNKLNPNFDKLLAMTDTDKSIQLRLPAEKLLLFQTNKMEILEQSMRMLLSLSR